MQKVKVTQNLFTKNMGLKVDGKRVFKNKYLNIDATYADSEQPVVLLEGYDTKSVYDLKTQKIVATNKDTLNVYDHIEDITKYDGHEDVVVDNYTEVVGFKYKDGNNTNLFLNNKVYKAPQDYKRIEHLAKTGSKNHTFVAVKKDNTAELINSNTYREKGDSFSISNLDKQNPYLFAIADSQTSNGTSFIEDVNFSKVRKSIDNYFLSLENVCDSKKELKDIKQERVNCINKINKHFNEEAKKEGKQTAYSTRGFNNYAKSVNDEYKNSNLKNKTIIKNKQNDKAQELSL